MAHVSALFKLWIVKFSRHGQLTGWCESSPVQWEMGDETRIDSSTNPWLDKTAVKLLSQRVITVPSRFQFGEAKNPFPVPGRLGRLFTGTQ
jgi:hypothetical protein